MSNLQTSVWELIGLSNSPGLLTLANGVLVLETQQGLRFQCPASQIESASWPWWQFHCAVKFRVQGTKFRVSFARPNGAAAAWSPVSAATNIFSLGSASKTGKAWRGELDKYSRPA